MASAFNQLVVRYQNDAFGLALRVTGDADTAADITQDAFLSAYRHLSTMRGTNFRSWILQIVRNGCMDYFRSRARRAGVSLDELLDDDPELSGTSTHVPASLVDDISNPENVALRTELGMLIADAIAKLPIEQRLQLCCVTCRGSPTTRSPTLLRRRWEPSNRASHEHEATSVAR